MITTPQLPPRTGYVEREVDGKRVQVYVGSLGGYAAAPAPELAEPEPTADELLNILLGVSENG